MSAEPLSSVSKAVFTREEIAARVSELGPWFHNLDLGGIHTAPDHFLGDYPALKWQPLSHALPADLTGKSVLDIGCNAGFYSMELKRRGAARVVGIDSDPTYLAQARFAAEVNALQIEFRELSIYDVAKLHETFDIVLFMGVLYHLRHPLLALDLIHRYVARDLLVFQSMQRGNCNVFPVENDYHFWAEDIFDEPGYPKLHFVEHRYCGDETNWWIPNRACAEALLRAAGFEILTQPEHEIYLCRRIELPEIPGGPRAVHPSLS